MASEAAGGIVLMVAAAAALAISNSPLAPHYFGVLKSYLGPLSVGHWINDGLMALFFLLVGLEIKREFLDGQLATWSRRLLPGIAALGGMVAPALIYVALNYKTPETLSGWAIPTATDIAFSLGVLALLGSRVPVSLKVFLTALAIIDDLGAVIIIAIFYTSGISVLFLAAAAAVLAILLVLNRLGVLRLWIYLVLGAVLWVLVLKSGVHATIAGVALALTIPLRDRRGHADGAADSPLHRLEHGLHKVVPFVVVPIFGFANAGVALGEVTSDDLGAVAIRLGIADMPAHANWTQLLGTALLCGIGFTMSLFVGTLAFASAPHLLTEAKLGILCGSIAAGCAGWLVLRLASRSRVARHDS